MVTIDYHSTGRHKLRWMCVLKTYVVIMLGLVGVGLLYKNVEWKALLFGEQGIKSISSSHGRD